jgi:hypothetical protein
MIRSSSIRLIGAELDAAVARVLGLEYAVEGESMLYARVMLPQDDDGERREFAPSTDWSQGGPIIEKAGIDLEWAPNVGLTWYEPDGDTWQAYAPTSDGLFVKTGPTPLIAAMRAFVASKP